MPSLNLSAADKKLLLSQISLVKSMVNVASWLHKNRTDYTDFVLVISKVVNVELAILEDGFLTQSALVGKISVIKKLIKDIKSSTDILELRSLEVYPTPSDILLELAEFQLLVYRSFHDQPVHSSKPLASSVVEEEIDTEIDTDTFTPF